VRIDRLNASNFKCFASREFTFHPSFNLIVGTNGAGKTSALDALAVATGSWFLGIRDAYARHIRPSEVFLKIFDDGNWEYQYPCAVEAAGTVLGNPIKWLRALNGQGNRTTYGDAASIKKLAERTDSAVRESKDVLLPLISYYGTGRLWQEPNDSYQVTDPLRAAGKEEASRFSGYWNSVDPRLSVSHLTRWIARQSWIAYQQNNRTPPIFEAVKTAIVGCVEGMTNLYFDAKLGEVVVEMEDGKHPFSSLSDGQRCMLAMVGDIAHKAAKLNPHLGGEVLNATPGVVLIDELDLHLHPCWQRRIIEDLRRTFPEIQFICTTHSPFLIQSLRQGKLIQLDDSTFGEQEYYNQSIEDIAESVQGVELPQKSKRFTDMMEAADVYYAHLRKSAGEHDAQLLTLRQRLDELTIPFSDDPAFAALLKFERETIAANKGGKP